MKIQESSGEELHAMAVRIVQGRVVPRDCQRMSAAAKVLEDAIRKQMAQEFIRALIQLSA